LFIAILFFNLKQAKIRLYEKYKIWGATAGMIRNLYERINEN